MPKQFGVRLFSGRVMFSALASITLLLTMPMWNTAIDAAAAEETTAASGVVRPDTVRGFNTYGAAMTPQNVDELRNEYGANVVRLQIHPQNYATKHNVPLDQAWKAVLDETEQGLIEAGRRGMMTVLDLHSVPIPGSKNAPAFWDDDATAAVLVDCWQQIVERFAPYRDYVWGYDLLNEAHNTAELPLGAAKWPGWAQQITDAIRARDTETPIIFEPSPGALPRGFKENEWIDAGPGYPIKFQGDFPLLDDDNVIYSVHWYELHDYTHQGIAYNNASPVSTDWPDKMVYPGTNGDQSWDKETLRELMRPVLDFQHKYNVPIYVGEFSTVRWAPGASQYIRDSVELFEEYGWSWTYHSYRDWHGWQLDYTDTMTSDVNSANAIATNPTDRELTLKSYFARNEYVAPIDIPRTPADLVRNGDFADDADADGLADGWLKGANAQTSIVDGGGGAHAHQVQVSASGQRGLDQEWITITPGNRYRLTAKLKVDAGQVKFWHYDVTNNYVAAGNQVVGTVGPTGGTFVDQSLEFVPESGAGKVSVRLWANTPAIFSVKDVQLIDLGPSVVITPPSTTAQVVPVNGADPTRVTFAALAAAGSTITRTEYRIVGASDAWTKVPSAGVTLPDVGRYVIGYRSVDSAGLVEPGRAIAVTVADTTAPTTSVKDGPSFTVGDAGTYSLVSFKLHDAGLVDRVTVNGVVKDLTNNAWSDVNFLEPGVFGAVAGENTLTVYDVAGNSASTAFTLTN